MSPSESALFQISRKLYVSEWKKEFFKQTLDGESTNYGHSILEEPSLLSENWTKRLI
jgi:hypothetical protein